MAGRLSSVGSRILGGNGVAARSAAASFRARSGMGLPVGKHIVPNEPVRIWTCLFYILIKFFPFNIYLRLSFRWNWSKMQNV